MRSRYRAHEILFGLDPPSAPTSPSITGASGGTVNTTTPTLTFVAANRATSHIVQWSTDNFATVVGEVELDMPTAEYTHTVALANFTSYSWRVAGINAAGPGPWSDVLTVIVADPSALTGINLWLDAADASTLWKDTGATTPAAANTDQIALWQDKSGSGNHVTQGTAGNRPTLATAQFNGRNVVKFTKASSQRLAKTSYSPTFTEMAVFIVLSHATVPADFDGIVSAIDASGADFDDVNGFTFYFPAATKPEFLQRASGGAAYISLTGTTISPSTGVAFVEEMIAGSGTATMRVNGSVGKTDTYSSLNCTPTIIVIGARASNGAATTTYFNGNIAELIILTTVPDVGTITGIRNYLMTKWGIS